MNNKINEFEKKLKYLTRDAIKEEIKLNSPRLERENLNDIVEEIYLKRGLDTKKIKKGLFSNLLEEINLLFNVFKNKEKNIKKKMIIEIIYIVLLLILIKIPFNLVSDIGYEYITLITSNEIVTVIWDIIFLLLYTIIVICSGILLLKNFNEKYKNTN